MKIAFVGSGNMAAALMGGLVTKGTPPNDILAIDPGQDARERCSSRYGVATAASAAEANLQQFDVVVLAVKPQVLHAVAAELAPFLRNQLVLSVAAGIRMEDLSRWLGGYRKIVRTMPNTPAQIGHGATGLVALHEVNDQEKKLATDVMEAVGVAVWVDEESKLDAVTAVSGSGPAYVFYFIESLCEAGIQLGLSPEQSKKLALSTFEGASMLAAASSDEPSTLRQQVTSKGGTTAAAIAAFEDASLKQHIINGAIACKLRAVQLGSELGNQ